MQKRTVTLHVVVGGDSGRNVPFLPRPVTDATIRCEYRFVLVQVALRYPPLARGGGFAKGKDGGVVGCSFNKLP